MTENLIQYMVQVIEHHGNSRHHNVVIFDRIKKKKKRFILNDHDVMSSTE